MDERPILICFDGSDAAIRAVDAAVALFPGRRAVVVDIGQPMTPEDGVYAAYGRWEGSFALERAQVGAERARDAGAVAEARGVVASPPWDGVLALAEEIDAAVIVTGGAQGRVDTFAQPLVRHARRPVLVVPPDDR